LSLNRAKPLLLDAYESLTLAELAPIIEGKPDVTRISELAFASWEGKSPATSWFFGAKNLGYGLSIL
jgi:hypothetical protein